MKSPITTFLSFIHFFFLSPFPFTLSLTTVPMPTDLYDELNPGNESSHFDPSAPIESFSPEMSMYYSWFCSIAYCTVDMINTGECCNSFYENDTFWEIVDLQQHPKDTKNTFILLKSSKYKKFVLAFPGTRGNWQLFDEVKNSGLENLFDNEEKFSGIGIGSFYKNQAYEIMPLILKNKDYINQQEHTGYQMIFTGHSLGASMAAVVALLSVQSEEYRLLDINVVEPVLLTYGQPRTGNPVFDVYVMNRIPHVFRVVRNKDLIVNIPPCTVGVLSTTCNGFYKETFGSVEELDITYVERNKPKPTGGFYHHGGLYLMNNEMTEITYCDMDIGENYSEKKCSNDIQMDVTFGFHNYYFTEKQIIPWRCNANIWG